MFKIKRPKHLRTFSLSLDTESLKNVNFLSRKYRVSKSKIIREIIQRFFKYNKIEDFNTSND